MRLKLIAITNFCYQQKYEHNLILTGDCLIELKKLDANSIDAVVTDPPYGLKFMGKKWDYDVPSVEVWQEVIRVLKPGGHLLSFGGTRTYHRMVVAIEDAGFEIRDQIQWLYGSGFPKSHNIKDGDFKGWGTALKPANEPIVLVRKPLEKGFNISQNVEKYGCGALNIDTSRVETDWENDPNKRGYQGTNYAGGSPFAKEIHEEKKAIKRKMPTQGRWPANIILDETAAEMLDEQSGGNTSRFFYVAKASKRERNAGLEGMPQKFTATMSDGIGAREHNENESNAYNSNHHPTVKPIKLMEYLCKLITPPNGVVLDPFMGSGSTGIAAKNLNFKFIGIEKEKEYVEIAEKRIEAYV